MLIVTLMGGPGRRAAAALCLCLAIAAVPLDLAAQERRTVVAGKEYDTSPAMRRWFGDGYRDIWATPFEVPVLELATEAGGLEPVRQVGGLQTPGLAMRGADGRAYTFRSLHKEPERLLPPEWRDGWPARIMRDATSATHPGAALMLPVLAEAAGVPHTRPRLVLMPDDARLGQFRATFANQVGTFEEFPTPATPGYAGFRGATAIISSADLWERWLSGPQERIDRTAMVRARLLDLFVDNYDRRRGQWRWMRLPGEALWTPLPEDPDMAFVRRDGLVSRAARQRRPQLLEFSAEYPGSLEGPTLLASEVDRWLLSDVEKDLFLEVARELQAAWTDTVLERAAAQLPAEWAAKDNGSIAAALRSRREAFVPYVERFYRVIASRVDVHLSNVSERITIRTQADGTTTVTATAGTAATPYFDRTFRPEETSEVRIHVHGGDDQIERTGTGPIHVRVVSDGGSASVRSDGPTTEVWAVPRTVTGNQVSRRDPWVNPEPVPGAPWIEPRSYGHVSYLMPAAWYAPDVGFVLGASLTRTTYGFRAVPAAKQQSLRGGFALGSMAGKAQYDGVFRRSGGTASLNVRALASGVEQINYFGLGNETAELPHSRYRSRQTVLAAAAGVRLGSASPVRVTVGPEIRHAWTGDEDDTLLIEEAPYGSGPFTTARVRVNLEIGPRPVVQPGVLALSPQVAGPEPPDQTPGSGIRLLASAAAVPAVLDVEKTYARIEGQVVAHTGSNNVQLAFRLGGARVFGDYPYFDAAYIGGTSARAYRNQRFGGDASVFANLDLRAFLTGPKFTSVFPVRFGVIGFVDAGRVWLSGERSGVWHPSGGGGVMAKPLGTNLLLRFVGAYGSEGTLIYAGSGFQF